MSQIPHQPSIVRFASGAFVHLHEYDNLRRVAEALEIEYQRRIKEEGMTDNPVSCNPKRHCFECDGEHEPSGARSDCILHWRARAIKAEQRCERARTLLLSATPHPKHLNEEQQRKWCEGFGKWFA